MSEAPAETSNPWKKEILVKNLIDKVDKSSRTESGIELLILSGYQPAPGLSACRFFGLSSGAPLTGYRRVL